MAFPGRTWLHDQCFQLYRGKKEDRFLLNLYKQLHCYERKNNKQEFPNSRGSCREGKKGVIYKFLIFV